jgi:hypothetical protein
MIARPKLNQTYENIRLQSFRLITPSSAGRNVSEATTKGGLKQEKKPNIAYLFSNKARYWERFACYTQFSLKKFAYKGLT